MVAQKDSANFSFMFLLNNTLKPLGTDINYDNILGPTTVLQR